MSMFEVLMIAVGLSMDAFAVSVGKGLTMHRADMRASLALAGAFGVFQALMPLLGWALSASFAAQAQSVGGWVALALLGAIGGKMVWDGVAGNADDEGGPFKGVGIAELLVLAVATSIDALAVGVAFGVLRVSPFPAAAVIGAVTFGLSLAGVTVGRRVGAGFGRPATIAGGIILLAIGLKIAFLP